MILEIGTSDYDTLAGKEDGVFIEPVKYYFDKLPNCNKENVAIGMIEGVVDMYYTTEEVIKELGMNWYARGCSNVGEIHPWTYDELIRLGYDTPMDYVSVQPIQMIRIKSIIDKYNITEISLLKLDAESWDIEILNDFLDTVDILPDVIQFEVYSAHSNYMKQLNDLTKRITKRGYEIKYNDELHSMICTKQN